MVHHYQGILLFKLNMPLPVNIVRFHLDVEYRPCLTQSLCSLLPSPSGYRPDRVDASTPEFPEIQVHIGYARQSPIIPLGTDLAPLSRLNVEPCGCELLGHDDPY